MRTTIELPEEQAKSLKKLCKEESISHAEAIRRAVHYYISNRNKTIHSKLRKSFGIWKKRNIDGLEYQQKIREEWNS